MIDKQRQQLRLSMALARKPIFNIKQDSTQINSKNSETPSELAVLKKNIVDCQLDILTMCAKIYKFVDYLHDRRHINSKLKEGNPQIPQPVLNCWLYKIKADYLRFVYECLSGEDGLLKGCDQKHDFK